MISLRNWNIDIPFFQFTFIFFHAVFDFVDVINNFVEKFNYLRFFSFEEHFLSINFILNVFDPRVILFDIKLNFSGLFKTELLISDFLLQHVDLCEECLLIHFKLLYLIVLLLDLASKLGIDLINFNNILAFSFKFLGTNGFLSLKLSDTPLRILDVLKSQLARFNFVQKVLLLFR